MRYSRWDQSFSTEETNELLIRASHTLASRISCSELRAHIIACLTRNDVRALCDLDLNYSDLSISDAIAARQVLAFFTKRDDLVLGIDKTAVAFGKFKEAESLCADTNACFRNHARGLFQFRPRVEAVLFSAQRKIARILGTAPSFKQMDFRFGPGATTNVKRSDASPRLKLSSALQCSEDLLPLVNYLLEEMPHLTPDLLSLDGVGSESVMVDLEVTPSRLCFVPKSYKTDRSIATEPGLNVMLQLGIGDWMKNRLGRFGIDIADQSLNQRLAREGSLTGALATLDLSSASDTISRELVYHLLPLDWFLLLDHAKTSEIETPEGILRQEKFSSMGNGFTFPLETLIFYALTSAVVDSFDGAFEEVRVSVYGDDIIVPVYAYDALCEVLTACGFVPNLSKSFSKGPFRESCGKDYLKGIDVRPCYQKTRLSCADVFRIHNFFYRGYDDEMRQFFADLVPDHLKKYGPDGYGDGHLLGDWKPKPHKRGIGWAGWTFETFTFGARKKYRALPGDYVYPSYSIYVSGKPRPMFDVGRDGQVLRSHEQGSPPAIYDKRGLLGDILPGRKGYKCISIYTLAI